MFYSNFKSSMEIATLLFACVLLCGAATAEDVCPFNYTRQPPVHYDCNPTGVLVELPCAADPYDQPIDWYYTRNPAMAGREGIKIDQDDVYNFFFSINRYQAQLKFYVNNETIGYYWCELRNVNDTRPSTVVSLCVPEFYDTTESCVLNDLRFYDALIGTECASIDSPTVFPRDPLPDGCMPSSDDVIIHTSTISLSSSVSHLSAVTSTILATSAISSFPSSSPIPSLYSSPSISPTSSLSISQTPTSSNLAVDVPLDQSVLLYTLIGVCAMLSIVAIIIMIVIIVLCKLNAAHTSHFPTSKAEEVEEVTWNKDGQVKIITYSHDDKERNGFVNRDMSITNPNYEINRINVSSNTSSSPSKNTSGSVTPSSLNGQSDYMSPLPLYANTVISPPPIITHTKRDEDYEEIDKVSSQPMYAVLEDPSGSRDVPAPPGEGLYDTPWGALPTGIKRSVSRTKSQSSHPPSLTTFDDRDYDILPDDEVYSSIPA